MNWWIVIAIVAIGVVLSLSIVQRKGIFISPWSLQLRAFYRKYSKFGITALFSLFISQRRRTIELVRGIMRVTIVLAAGILLGLIHSLFLEGFVFDISGGALGTAWQVHSVIIGFSFVSLTFAWEEIKSNTINEEISILFVEDIGSIRTVAFVFGANLAIGIVAFIYFSTDTVETIPIYTIAVLFVVSILTVAKSFIDALDLLFYKNLNKEIIHFAKKDLEREIISTSSTPNQILAESVPDFDEISIYMPNISSRQTTVSSRDIGKRGTVTDINLRKMRELSEIINQRTTASINRNPIVDMQLTEDTTVLTLEGDICEEQLKQIKRQLRKGLRTREKR